MRLIQLKYFVEICDHGSLSLASKFLFVTQPTLSSAINNLEKEYNIKLFERKGNALILTKDGEFFYEKAKAILEQISIFEKDLKDLADKKTTIRIGVPPMIGSFLFPKIYDKYMLEHIDAKFEIWEDGSLSIRNKIMNHTLDLGFSILNESVHEGYQK
ncbi:MAG: LysR family transcriptional regulator [Acholeplasmataceae bacterium]